MSYISPVFLFQQLVNSLEFNILFWIEYTIRLVTQLLNIDFELERKTMKIAGPKSEYFFFFFLLSKLIIFFVVVGRLYKPKDQRRS